MPSKGTIILFVLHNVAHSVPLLPFWLENPNFGSATGAWSMGLCTAAFQADGVLGLSKPWCHTRAGYVLQFAHAFRRGARFFVSNMG